MGNRNRSSQTEGEQEAQENDHVVDDVDMTAPQPIDDTPEQPPAEPVSDSNAVVGRRNEDLPLENPRN